MSRTKEQRREDYLFFKARGICVACRKRRAFRGHVHCPECMEKLALRGHNTTPERRRELYQKHKADGICVSCKSRPAEAGKTKCPQCAAKQARSAAKAYVRRVRPDWMCLRCSEPHVEGKRYCERHMAQAREQCAMMRARIRTSAHPWRDMNEAVFRPHDD